MGEARRGALEHARAEVRLPLSDARDGRRALLAAAALALVTALLLHLPAAALDRQGDEGHHYRQIQRFCSADWTLEPRLTTFPGFHALLAAIAAPAGRCDDVAFLRLVNTLIGAAGVVLFHLARRALAGDDLLRTAQFAMLPVLAPYHAQLYTDSLATTLVLAALALSVRRPAPGAALAGVSLLVRQTNAPWIVFLALDQALGATGNWRARAAAGVRAAWPGLVALAGFAVFVLVHGGVALKERKAHPVGLHVGNVWLFFGLAGLLLLPHAVSAVRASPRVAAVAAAVAAGLFLLTFAVDHPYNRFGGFLRNDLLLAVERGGAARVVAASFVATGAALVAARAGVLPRALWIPLAMALVPPWLLEQRYTIVPLAMLLLYLPGDAKQVEVPAVAWSAALTAWLVAGRVGGAFLL